MAGFPPITVRQPRPHDIVNDPVGICGIGTGSEGTTTARVRAANGTELKRVPIRAEGTGIWGNFQVKIDLSSQPPTARIVREPSGPVAQAITVVEARYKEETDFEYDTVTILPDGVSVSVQEVH